MDVSNWGKYLVDDAANVYAAKNSLATLFYKYKTSTND